MQTLSFVNAPRQSLPMSIHKDSRQFSLKSKRTKLILHRDHTPEKTLDSGTSVRFSSATNVAL